MPRQIEGFLSDDTDDQKELTRKLYWAISSTIPLNQAQKASTFKWCADLAERLLARGNLAPPPATRSQQLTGRRLAMAKKNGYALLAGGGAAGSSDGKRRQEPPSRALRSGRPSSLLMTPQLAGDFQRDQAAKQVLAIEYMVSENLRLGITRSQRSAEERAHGSTNSTS